MNQEPKEIILQLPEDIHKLCRICLSVSNTELHSHEVIIFDEYNNLTEVAQMMQFCTSLKVLFANEYIILLLVFKDIVISIYELA